MIANSCERAARRDGLRGGRRRVPIRNVDYLRISGILGPIVSLLVLGFGLTLRSGVSNMTTSRGFRQAASNLSRTVLLVGASLFGLMLLQEFIGFKLSLM